MSPRLAGGYSPVGAGTSKPVDPRAAPAAPAAAAAEPPKDGIAGLLAMLVRLFPNSKVIRPRFELIVVVLLFPLATGQPTQVKKLNLTSKLSSHLFPPKTPPNLYLFLPSHNTRWMHVFPPILHLLAHAEKNCTKSE